MIITLARVVETCSACPSQWDAWTVDGQYLYLRYRSGIGTAEQQPSPDPDTWDISGDALIAYFGGPSMDGSISLEEFCTHAGLTLTPETEISG